MLRGWDDYECNILIDAPQKTPCLCETHIPVSGDDQQKALPGVSGKGQAVAEVAQEDRGGLRAPEKMEWPAVLRDRMAFEQRQEEERERSSQTGAGGNVFLDWGWQC